MISTFLGIPYARAPRFGAPEPVAWTGECDTAEPGPLAPQTPSRLDRVVGRQEELPQSEDCLTLNVWTPDVTGPRPVLVFVHGGGFLTGGGGLAWYRGDRLAARGDFVVVTIGYRLGFLGLGHVPGAPANRAVRDVLAALTWVRENIAAFGGDPDRITAAGQSAGALCLLALLGTPKADGLFRSVVLQSTPAGVPLHDADQAGRSTRLLCDELGTEELTAVLVPDLLAVQGKVARTLHAADPSSVAPPFFLTVDDDLIGPDLVRRAAARAGGRRILLGTTRDEATAFFDEPGTATERLFHEPTARLADLLADRPWQYEVDWSPAGNPFGATHCIELPLQFGTLDAWAGAPMLAGLDPDEGAAMTDRFQRLLIAFVRESTVDDQERYIVGR